MTRRHFYLLIRTASTIRHWFSRRFTKTGMLVLGSLVASAIVGLDTNLTMAYQIFTFLFSLLLISMLSGILFRGRFIIHRILPRFGTVNIPVPYRINVQNKTTKRQDDLLLMETQEESGLSLKEVSLPSLPPGGEGEVHLEIVPPRRGYLRLAGIRVGRTDPFGLFKSFVTIPAPQSLLVLPKRYPLSLIQLPGTRIYQPGGVSLAFSVGESEEFISLREYRPGDPLRRIYWRGWARTDRPIVKEYQDEFFVRHGLILDTFQTEETQEVFEEAASVAASFASSMTTQESLLDLMFIGTEAYCFTSGRGVANTDRMLEILAVVQPCVDKPFTTLLPLVLGRAASLSGCICVFLKWDAERKDLVRHVKALGIPLLALVVTDGQSRPEIGTEYAETVRVLETGKIEEGLSAL